MSDMLTALYIEAVGQVVAALTRTSADGELEPTAVAGEALLLRLPDTGGVIELLIPASQLAASSVPSSRDILVQPSGYGFADGSVEALGDDTSFDTTSLSVMIPSNAATDLDVWAMVQNGLDTEPLLATGTIPTGATQSSSLFSPLAPGSYQVLAAAVGHHPYVGSVDVV